MAEVQDARLADRIRAHTAANVNERIDRQTEGSIRHYAGRGRDEIVRRLDELGREWDVDRALIAFFSAAGTITLQLGLSGKRRRGFFHFLRVQLGFLMMHALIGWCPPMALFRRLGFRTAKEIEAERTELARLLDEATIQA